MQESGVGQNALLNEFCDHDPPATASPSRENAPLFKADTDLVADLELEGAWRVEHFDSDGAGYIGQSAEVPARDYYDAIERGALKTRIADAQVVTAKKVVSFPQKRRRPVR
jgi:hypothetical protein